MTLTLILLSINSDDEGRSIVMEAEEQGSLYLFVNIYAPNKTQDQCRFFDKLNNNIEDCVRKVYTEGVLITDPKKILQEIHNLYSNLCKRDPLSSSEDILNSFLNNPKILKISDNYIRICDGKLTVDECYKSLQLFEGNKSPGNDGLTVEFYRAFWHVLGRVMVDSLNCSYDYGELSNSQLKRSYYYFN